MIEKFLDICAKLFFIVAITCFIAAGLKSIIWLNEVNSLKDRIDNLEKKIQNGP